MRSIFNESFVEKKVVGLMNNAQDPLPDFSVSKCSPIPILKFIPCLYVIS